MNKTRIEWCDYTINPIKGLCQGGCWYCYARRMYKRFKWNEEVRFFPEDLNRIALIKRPSRIFICSTHDLFGEWIPDKWIFDIITKLQNYPQHAFLLLTKNATRYADWTFRDNFWLGGTYTGEQPYRFKIKSENRNVNLFLSMEPLLAYPRELFLNSLIKWIIVGALTGRAAKKFTPKKEWLERIIFEADRINTPVFMKNNLKPYWKGKLRQELPNTLKTGGCNGRT